MFSKFSEQSGEHFYFHSFFNSCLYSILLGEDTFMNDYKSKEMRWCCGETEVGDNFENPFEALRNGMMKRKG